MGNNSTKMSCSICMEDIKETDNCTLTCNHKYHLSCILQLFKTKQDFNNKCPLCRKEFTTKMQPTTIHHHIIFEQLFDIEEDNRELDEITDGELENVNLENELPPQSPEQSSQTREQVRERAPSPVEVEQLLEPIQLSVNDLLNFLQQHRRG